MLLDLPDQNRFLITVPFSVASDTELESTLEELRARGFVRGLWQSEFVDLSSPLKFSGASADLMVVVDRLVGGQTSAERLTDSIESAYELGGGSCRILIEGDASSLGSSEDIAGRKWARYDYSRQLRCVPCDVEYPEPEPRLFSYNSPLGACPTCEGFGSIQVRDMSCKSCWRWLLTTTFRRKSRSENCRQSIWSCSRKAFRKKILGDWMVFSSGSRDANTKCICVCSTIAGIAILNVQIATETA